ncbi:phage tail assembly chaperone [uncultured Sphingomonas sp.]|uniref:phage tail assembly chaperone n=1 Tax=uncultured Sphingomonas sp. TaxID=158754 RepID=UPI0025DDFB81|nr:phage tail assembly chaperone [uncultured Sphingomonas sp.]
MGDFARAARRLAGVAGVAWGWSPDAFWRATPDEVAAMVEAMMGEQAEPADGGVLTRLRERYPDG